MDKQYDDLVQLLKEFVDPQPSQWALQQKFISRNQMEHETVNEFSVALKKMTVNCEFHCCCGKSVADLFLKLQFIRGLKDVDIRTKLLQDREKRMYQDLVNIASAMELAKSESKTVSHNNLEQSELNQIKYKIITKKVLSQHN